MDNGDRDTLHYMRGKLDSLCDLVEKHIEQELVLESKVNRIQSQVNTLWLLGPIVTALLAAGYGLKKIFMEGI